MEKNLTIVVPTYNMERYLNRCLDSLIVPAELMERLEVLVINDGSKDRSSEIAHSYEEKYPQTFRVIDKENGNYGSCVNRGLKEAQGKYIKILDADDWFDTENFEILLKTLHSIDADCIMTDMQQVNVDGTAVCTCNYSLPKKQTFSLGELIRLNSTELIWMHCVTYRTDNLRAIDYRQTEGISYTDQEWIFLPMATCKTVYYLPVTVYKYLVGRDGQTMNHDVFKKNFWQEIKGTINMTTELGHYENGDDVAYAYLAKRLLGRSMVCYGTFLERYQMGTCYEEMVALDQALKTYVPDLYKELEAMYRLNPFKSNRRFCIDFPRLWVILVWIWRKKRFPKQMPLIQRFLRMKNHNR